MWTSENAQVAGAALLIAHHQDRTVGVANYGVRDASHQRPAHPAEAPAPHDYQACAHLLAEVDDLHVWPSPHEVGSRHGHPLALDPQDPRGRAISFGLSVGVLLLNELWNYGFFGMRSTLAGFLGIAVFLALLTALMVVLRRYERISAWVLVPYYVWVLYDLAWTYELWRLNGAAGS